MNDYRVSHLLQECANESFKITNVVDGDIVITGDAGTELKLPLRLPRKIVLDKDDTVTTITKMGISIRKKSEKQLKLQLHTQES